MFLNFRSIQCSRLSVHKNLVIAFILYFISSIVMYEPMLFHHYINGTLETDKVSIREIKEVHTVFPNFSCMFLNPIFSNLNLNCSYLSNMRNLQEQVKKALSYQNFFWPSTVWINCSSDLKNFANSQPSASNFKTFSRSLKVR